MVAAVWGTSPGWHSRTTFVLALAAATIGMGSLWRFSWLMGTNGGGAFMLTYVASLLLLSVPIMVAEIVIGSHGRAGPPLALRRVADRNLISRRWMALGVLASVSGLLLAACLVVVAGWALAYIPLMLGNTFSDASAPMVADAFTALLADPSRQLLWQTLFVAVLLIVSAQGVRRGLGIFVWLAVPLLITLLAVLVRFNLDNGNLVLAREFLFSVKAVDFTREAVLAAVSHALLTFGLGLGVGMAYGAYTPRRIPVLRSILAVAIFNIAIALLAGLAVYPLILANNLVPNGGPGLLFISAPYAFGNIPHGEGFGVAFFLLTVITALAAGLALLEPAIGTLRQALRGQRWAAVLVCAGVVWLLAAAITSSLAGEGWFGNHNLLLVFDELATEILIPLVCLLTVLLVGWRLHPAVLREQLSRESDAMFSLWRGLLRYIAPLAIVALVLARLL
ncbi:sodium-dependent transporter [Halioglobus maricola]|uniref:Sodium-dependent transporter n=1 Tax=Halioglobus maricola TaxID=2601894 RepID=A0A5P9NMN5_9GAMM|nr:sodium-dependent transporter [Halioglobus maricola]QFU76766.1 sodium-dependent transporter [Halioglobus maricola]